MSHSLMGDFESSVLSLLNQIYSDIPQVACLFHLSKNFFRRYLLFIIISLFKIGCTIALKKKISLIKANDIK